MSDCKCCKAVPGTGGDKYNPMEERTGSESTVYFTRDLSPEGLQKIFDCIAGDKLTGKAAIKLHTGEKNGPNIIPGPWVKELIEKKLPDASIVETNTYKEIYMGNDRYQLLDADNDNKVITTKEAVADVKPLQE